MVVLGGRALPPDSGTDLIFDTVRRQMFILKNRRRFVAHVYTREIFGKYDVVEERVGEASLAARSGQLHCLHTCSLATVPL